MNKTFEDKLKETWLSVTCGIVVLPLEKKISNGLRFKLS